MMAILKDIQYSIIALVYVFGLLMRLLVSLPFHLFRAFISNCAKYWNPELRQVISDNLHIGRDGSLLLSSNLLISLRVQGIMDIELFTQRFLQKCVNARQFGILEFPELQEKIILYLGYPFWARDVEFDIRNHIFYEDGVDLSDKAQQHFQNETIFLQTPFKMGERSPWVILISIDRQINKSHIWLKFHHSLGDGVSMYNTLMRVADNIVPIQPPTIKKSSRLSKLRQICSCKWIPTDVIKNCIECDWSPQFQIPSEKMSEGRHYAKSNRIPKHRIKEIAVSLSVPFTSVLICAISGAMREYLLKLNLAVPPYLLCCIPIRVPKQRPGLILQVRLGLFKFPVGVEDLRDRLSTCGKSLEDTVTSSFSTWAALDRFIANGYPMKWTPKTPSFSFTVTSFPGPSSSISLCHGARVEDIHFVLHGGQYIGLFFTTLTYNNGMSIVLSADQNVFQHEENAKLFMESLEQQINDLHSLIPIQH